MPTKGHPQRTCRRRPSMDTDRRRRAQTQADTEMHGQILKGTDRYCQIQATQGTSYHRQKQTHASSPQDYAVIKQPEDPWPARLLRVTNDHSGRSNHFAGF